MCSVDQKYVGLMKQKLDEVSNILATTKGVHFTGIDTRFDEEAEMFTNLYERRDTIVARIKIIDENLSAPEYVEVADKSAEGAAINDKIKETAKAILALDKKNMVVSAKLFQLLRSNIKQVKMNKAINNAYGDVKEGYESSTGYHFDSRN